MSVSLNKLMGKLQPAIDWSGPSQPIPPAAAMPSDLAALLQVHNGVSVFAGGLRVFGATTSLLHSIAEWNQELLWRFEYKGLCHGLTFFAEDVFGNQFGFTGAGEIFRFHAETGDREAGGRNFCDWLDRTLAEPEEELSLWLLNDWNRSGIPVQLSQHLCPKVPFLAHGPYECSNLYTCDRVESMRFKGGVADQIRNFPTGTTIEIKVR